MVASVTTTTRALMEKRSPVYLAGDCAEFLGHFFPSPNTTVHLDSECEHLEEMGLGWEATQEDDRAVVRKRIISSIGRLSH